MSLGSQLRLQRSMYLTITPLMNPRVVMGTLLLILDFFNTYSLPTGATVMTSMSTTVVEQSTTTLPITLDWSSNVSSMYPPRYNSKLCHIIN